MVWIVVAFNVVLGLICWRLAWQFWQLRRVIGNAAKSIETADRNSFASLNPAPKAITTGQQAIKQLRSHPQRLDLQRQRLQQLLGFLQLIQWVWFRGGVARLRPWFPNRKP